MRKIILETTIAAVALALWSPHEARAESFYSPLFCKASESMLVVSNSSSETEPFWIQNLGSVPLAEKNFEVKPGASEALPLGTVLPSEATAVSVKTRSQSKLLFGTVCKNSREKHSLVSASSPWKHFELSAYGMNSPASLLLVNLSAQKTNVEVEIVGTRGTVVERDVFTVTDAFAKSEFKLKSLKDAHFVRVRSEGRWVGAMTNELHETLLPTDDIVVFDKIPAARYFSMRSRNPANSDGYVVPLTQPKMIEQAREQIANPLKAKLLVAKVEKNLVGSNRNLLSENRTPWSWQITEAIHFSDFALIDCDGTPSLVEERLDEWMINTNSTICFWNYRLERELTEKEVQQLPSSLRLGPGSLPQKP